MGIIAWIVLWLGAGLLANSQTSPVKPDSARLPDLEGLHV
jgi:hypothetical protein